MTEQDTQPRRRNYSERRLVDVTIADGKITDVMHFPYAREGEHMQWVEKLLHDIGKCLQGEASHTR